MERNKNLDVSLAGSLRGEEEAGFVDLQETVSTNACKRTVRLLGRKVSREIKTDLLGVAALMGLNKNRRKR